MSASLMDGSARVFPLTSSASAVWSIAGVLDGKQRAWLAGQDEKHHRKGKRAGKGASSGETAERRRVEMTAQCLGVTVERPRRLQASTGTCLVREASGKTHVDD